ncbi:UDP-glucose 4-epimerase family protein [Photobacterium ganghwense]|uniref:UDP-glucose 4-epimerase family protein n=1 Tax=Photobacterium ganghwense TaxID=320778 RepID=UPI001C2CEF88|nr:SDR family oxidoreductase [Photobacterium ganghwense]MBV1838995.1 SDR family oxidoreductase [Photobacterium ganghwense]
MKIFVTGATGFIGSALIQKIETYEGYSIIAATRHPSDSENHVCLNLEDNFDVSSKLEGLDVVIHCAAKVHVMNATPDTLMSDFNTVNTKGTLNLARQAAAAGAKRFIFLSTIKVNGESTESGKPFTPDVERAPHDLYALSKYEAELGLRELAEQTGMEMVIIRPPLIYGPGVKANFASLIKLASKGLPLPLGAIHNQRSMVYVGNLIDLIVNCISSPKAANKTFLVSDNDDLSTTQLLSALAKAMGKPSRLIPVPASWLMTVTKLLGKPAIGERLCGNLQLDISETKSCLGWTPPYSVAEGLKQTVSEPSQQK